MKQSVSVVIPSYNYAAWLPHAVDSCIAQLDYIKEIIIVDDHSTDGSFEIASEYQIRYPGVVNVYKNTGKGGNDARNLGFVKSTGRYIQWLDADDSICPSKLETQSSFLDENPAVDIIYSDWQLDTYATNGDIISTEIKKAGAYEDYLLELLEDNWQPPHNYLLRRSISQRLHDMKAWNPQTRAAQDREYYTKAAISGAVFAYVPGIMSIYNRRQVKSVSRALNHKDKSAIIIQLLLSFMSDIDIQAGIDPKKKLRYKKALYQQIAYLASYYQLPIGSEKPSMSNINWLMLPGIKSKLRVAKNLIFGGIKNR